MLSFSMSCYSSRGAIKTVQTNTFGTTYFPEYVLKLCLKLGRMALLSSRSDVILWPHKYGTHFSFFATPIERIRQ